MAAGSIRTYGVRKELAGELYEFSSEGELGSQVTRWLNKVSTVNNMVSVSSPTVGFPVSDWSVMRIYPRFL
eukprot:9481678-Pyramimonas_sp.AAC.1